VVDDDEDAVPDGNEGFLVAHVLFLGFVGQPERKLVPYKGLKFRVPAFSDVIYEFVVENGQAKALKQRDPSGEFTYTRK
jgi:hypothetical protein